MRAGGAHERTPFSRSGLCELASAAHLLVFGLNIANECLHVKAGLFRALEAAEFQLEAMPLKALVLTLVRVGP